MPNKPVVVKLMKELAIEGKGFKDTDAGKSVSEGLNELGKRMNTEFDSINGELKELKGKQKSVEQQIKEKLRRNQDRFDQKIQEGGKYMDKRIEETTKILQEEKNNLMEAMKATEQDKVELIKTMKRLEEANRRLQGTVDKLQKSSGKPHQTKEYDSPFEFIYDLNASK
ncbi:hypothetical protein ABW20_dc0108611 [Dactylellina cionopaga]|nr:hypothetical protein ABW20_dc0108611 [Dactylellina cionopaga]